jgi:hypothetical protein
VQVEKLVYILRIQWYLSKPNPLGTKFCVWNKYPVDAEYFNKDLYTQTLCRIVFYSAFGLDKFHYLAGPKHVMSAIEQEKHVMSAI